MPQQGKPVLLGIPFDAHSSYLQGAALAPPLIRTAMKCDSSNSWSENGVDLSKPKIFSDAGDLQLPQDASAFPLIEKGIEELLAKGLRPVSLGGDHSITYPIVRACARHFPDLTIIHFDAHPDLYDEFQGNRYSHACPFARIMEEKLVKRLVQVGIRTATTHQREQIKRFGLEVVEMRDWKHGLAFEFDTPVYISFDVDALDPAFAPGVSHREPGGLSTRQAIDLIQRIRGQVVGADIVEFNPRMDPLHVTGTVCAKLLKEIAARIIELQIAPLQIFRFG